MKIEKFFKVKDFWAGLIFTFFGAFTILEARNYAMGTTSKMGPGYFPYYLGIILVLVGAVTTIRSLWLTVEEVEPIVLRPLFVVTVAVLAFTFMVEPFGLAVATLFLVFISSIGGGIFRLPEVTILSLVLIALSLVLFVYLLQIPFKVLP